MLDTSAFGKSSAGLRIVGKGFDLLGFGRILVLLLSLSL